VQFQNPRRGGKKPETTGLHHGSFERNESLRNSRVHPKMRGTSYGEKEGGVILRSGAIHRRAYWKSIDKERSNRDSAGDPRQGMHFW